MSSAEKKFPDDNHQPHPDGPFELSGVLLDILNMTPREYVQAQEDFRRRAAEAALTNSKQYIKALRELIPEAIDKDRTQLLEELRNAEVKHAELRFPSTSRQEE